MGKTVTPLVALLVHACLRNVLDHPTCAIDLNDPFPAAQTNEHVILILCLISTVHVYTPDVYMSGVLGDGVK